MLITNGDLLTVNILEKLYTAKLDQLCVSAYDKKILENVYRIKKEKPSLFKIVEVMDFTNNISLDNRGGNVKDRRVKKVQLPLNVPCERVYKMIYIRPSGKVVSCFCDFHEVNVVGDVYKKTLKQVWFGEKFIELRKKLDMGNRDFSTLCRRCDYPGEGGFFKKHEK